ncbi:MAG: DUF4169 family protein [Pseudomonadota bacterium]
MSQPINLNQARKRRAKADAKRAADRNAAFHGLTKAKKMAARAEKERDERRHAGGRRTEGDDPGAKGGSDSSEA